MSHASRRAFLSVLISLFAVLFGAGCDKTPTDSGRKDPAKAQQPSVADQATPQPTASGRTYVVAWSVWTGWMPFKLMEQKGFLKQRAKEQGVNVELKEFKGYMDSVQAFAAKKVDAVAMTSMESLQPASNGVDSVGLLVNDISNGGDGVLLRGGDAKLEQIKGKTVLLEEFSVSHYLLNRALETKGLSEKDVKVKNIPGDEAGKAFLTDGSVQAVATWNPHLFQAVEAKKGRVVFSSREIPGEIIDFLVVSGDALKESPGLGRALVDAWYDAMRTITDPNTRVEAIEIMARAAGASVQDFNRMLADTDLYTDRKRCAEFLESEQLKQTMAKVKKFSFDKGLIKDASFEIGFGAAANQKLRFDSSFVRAAP
ncbi:MAG: ABC transporter substrate-binding protein [Polyangiaceae bacterium]|nr:ABC transporter substrate-binding protein [Polyangiaceae bacterium]